MKRAIAPAIILPIVLSACGVASTPSQSVIQTAVTLTQSVLPTSTAVPLRSYKEEAESQIKASGSSGLGIAIATRQRRTHPSDADVGEGVHARGGLCAGHPIRMAWGSGSTPARWPPAPQWFGPRTPGECRLGRAAR